MNKKYQILNADMLKILAMFFMLLDHMWTVGIVENNIFHYIGRLAFPIFAFQIVEGYFHTSNLKRYKHRLFIFALISEIPFNLMLNCTLFFPQHQNVLFTLLFSIFAIDAIEDFLKTDKLTDKLLDAFKIIFVLALSTLLLVDYYYIGIFTVLVFYIAKKIPKLKYLIMIFGISYIHMFVKIGDTISIEFGNIPYYFPTQGIAVLSLIPIFLYNGNKGKGGKILKRIGYWFYPVHALVLFLIWWFF